MRVAAIQSSFIPWRGYFDFIASVDVFVFLDDVQYTSRDWRSRNRIKTPKGSEWLTVPVVKGGRELLVYQATIDHSQNWTKKILGSWRANYARAPFFDDAYAILSLIDSLQIENLSALNIALTKRICEYLNISTPMILSTDLALSGKKTDRLIDLLTKLKASRYLSGSSADAYLDKDAFRRLGSALEYKSYDYQPYPQQWGAFDGAVSILDLIANCGPDAKMHIRSQSPDQVVIGSSKYQK